MFSIILGQICFGEFGIEVDERAAQIEVSMGMSPFLIWTKLSERDSGGEALNEASQDACTLTWGMSA